MPMHPCLRGKNKQQISFCMPSIGDNGATVRHLHRGCGGSATTIAGVGCNKHVGAGCNITTYPNCMGLVVSYFRAMLCSVVCRLGNVFITVLWIHTLWCLCFCILQTMRHYKRKTDRGKVAPATVQWAADKVIITQQFV